MFWVILFLTVVIVGFLFRGVWRAFVRALLRLEDLSFAWEARLRQALRRSRN